MARREQSKVHSVNIMSSIVLLSLLLSFKDTVLLVVMPRKSVMIQMTSGRERGWETLLLYYQDLLVNTGKCKVVCVGVCGEGGEMNKFRGRMSKFK